MNHNQNTGELPGDQNELLKRWQEAVDEARETGMAKMPAGTMVVNSSLIHPVHNAGEVEERMQTAIGEAFAGNDVLSAHHIAAKACAQICHDHNAALRARIEQLEDAIRTEQSGLAKGLEQCVNIANSYRWVSEGRGPYSFDDEAYKAETLRLCNDIARTASNALHKAGKDATAILHAALNNTTSSPAPDGLKKDGE